MKLILIAIFTGRVYNQDPDEDTTTTTSTTTTAATTTIPEITTPGLRRELKFFRTFIYRILKFIMNFLYFLQIIKK